MKLSHTPDMVSPKKPLLRKIWQLIINIARFILFGFIGGISAVSLFLLPIPAGGDPIADSNAPVIVSLLLFILCYYLTVAIHELGHLAGGALAGFKFVLLVLRPFRITREKQGIRFSFFRLFTLIDGIAISVPNDDNQLNRRIALYFVGGPLATLGEMVLIYILMMIFQGPLWVADVPILGVMWFFSAIGLVNLWPFRVSGFMTDGARLLTLIKGGPQAERTSAAFALAGTLWAGTRPRDLNPTLVQRALAFSDNSSDEAVVNFVAYQNALDKGKPARAAAYLDRALVLWQKISPMSRALYYIEAAYFEARYSKNPTVARAWLDRAKGNGLLGEKHARLRAEAAIFLAEGNLELAQDRAKQSLAHLSRSIDRGGIKAATEWLTEIIALSQTDQVASSNQGLHPANQTSRG